MKEELERDSQARQTEWDRGRRKLQEKDQELEMLKVEMFREIERLQVHMEKEMETLETSDKGVQTSDVVFTIEEERMWLMEDSTTEEYSMLAEISQETEQTTVDMTFASSSLELQGQSEEHTAIEDAQMSVVRAEASPFSRLLRWLWRYCCGCCRCCDCCGRECEEEEEENIV
jgi:hypothetical protein